MKREDDAKVKQEVKEADAEDLNIPVGKSARVAARDRAVQRSKIQKDLREEYIDDTETFGFATDVRKAEVMYQVNSLRDVDASFLLMLLVFEGAFIR